MRTVGLVIPSVGRPDSLARTLDSVRANASDLADVVVVARMDDYATHQMASTFSVRTVKVDRPGLAWAMKQGALNCGAEVVAFTDDDATIRPGWTARLASLYKDTRVGGAGGRDVIHLPLHTKVGRSNNVGRISFGKVVGGHHLATGEVRSVDHLKGVNCSFLREILEVIDVQSLIAGSGAQARNEFVISLFVRALGYDLVFDPELVVDHFPAERLADDTRNGNLAKTYESAFNERLGFGLAHDSRGPANLLFLLFAGYPHTPGLLRILRGSTSTEVKTVLRAMLDAYRVTKENSGLLASSKASLARARDR